MRYETIPFRDLRSFAATAAHPDAKFNPKCLCLEEMKTMNWKKLYLFRDQVEHTFRTLIDRRIRERHHEERRLAEQRTTMHQVWARKSCIADARSYRVARRFPMSAVAELDWT